MKYNLTPKQKELAKFIVVNVRKGQLSESFSASQGMPDELHFMSKGPPRQLRGKWQPDDLEVLGDAGFLRVKIQSGAAYIFSQHLCTLKGLIYEAVDSDFADETNVVPVSTLAHSHPPEIAMSLDRLRGRFPDPKKLGFLIMRFAAEKPYAVIVDAIKKTAEEHGLAVIRADEHEFHADLLSNVRTYLHGCGFGIAVYERIQTDEPNANVGFEVGYLMAMGKPVLLLKDKTAETLQSDLAGRLYKQFDPHDAEGTIPAQMTKWLEDYGIIVPKHK